jgi:Ino eighty subunit 1
MRRSHHRSRKDRRGEGSIIRALPRLAEMQDPFDDSEDDEVAAPSKNASSITNGDNKRMREKGYGGLAQLKSEPDDFGEQVSSYSAAFRRMIRRLERWENHDGPELGVIRPVKRPKVNGADHGDEYDDGYGDEGEGEGEGEYEGSPSKEMIDPAETEDEMEIMVHARRAHGSQLGRGRTNGLRRADTNGDTPMDDADDLDEVDKELLGLGDGDGDGDDGEGDGDGDGDEELDDVDKTLLGMDGDSDSE